jgi:uncharacterized protein YodC (DUF2158 family)
MAADEITTKFQPGSVVKLKSGGPPMTVDEFDEEDGKWCCDWFDPVLFTNRVLGWLDGMPIGR